MAKRSDRRHISDGRGGVEKRKKGLKRSGNRTHEAAMHNRPEHQLTPQNELILINLHTDILYIITLNTMGQRKGRKSDDRVPMIEIFVSVHTNSI